MSNAYKTAGKRFFSQLDGGTQIMGKTTDLLSFYGATPVTQQAATGGSPVTTLATSSAATMWGFATSTQANQVIAAMVALQTMGLIA